jgi:hypothetical protein
MLDVRQRGVETFGVSGGEVIDDPVATKRPAEGRELGDLVARQKSRRSANLLLDEKDRAAVGLSAVTTAAMTVCGVRR